MFKIINFGIIILVIIFPLCVFSQLNELEIEQIYESSEDFEYTEEQIDYIEFTRNNKINLYKATIDDLVKFPYFDINTAFRILEYARNNPNTTIDKLSKDIGLRGEQILILEHCTYIAKQPLIEKFKCFFRSRYRTSNDPIYGFEKSKYLGDKLDLSSRMKLQIDNIGINLVVDKDAGERNIIEYYSGNLWYNNKKNLSITLGDFEYQLGMGNVLWSSFGDRKGINIIAPVLRFKQSNKPYFSTLDYSRFRGVAVDYSLDLLGAILKIGGFYSNIAKSATYDSTKGLISSIYTSGLYRTSTEIKKIDAFSETAISGNLSITYDDFTLGTGIFKLGYDKNINTSSSKFANSQNNLYKTIFGLYNYGNLSLGTEFSLDEFNNVGFTVGSIYSIGRTKYALQIRSFGQYFRSPYGTMFGEFSYPANEHGIYFGLYTPVNEGIKLSSFIDLFKSYGSTYSIPAQVKGLGLFNQLDYIINSKINGLTRFYVENKTNNKKVLGINEIYQETDFLLRQEINFSTKNELNIRIRGEITYVGNAGVIPDEWGFANFLEISLDYDFLKFGSRVSLFNTDSYNSAIWQYEYFMQGYMYSFPAYLNGSRYIAFVKFKLKDNIKFDLVYTYTRKNNVKTLGSGNDEVLRNYSNKLILQLNVIY